MPQIDKKLQNVNVYKNNRLKRTTRSFNYFNHFNFTVLLCFYEADPATFSRFKQFSGDLVFLREQEEAQTGGSMLNNC